MFSLDDDVNEAIENQRAIFRAIVSTLKEQLPEALPAETVHRIQKIYLVGCGDSYFAALASRLFFERTTRLTIEPVESMAFSRYLVDSMPEHSLVLGISNSGRVARTTEAIIQARKQGAYTIALTGFGEREAAQEADAALVAAVPNVRSALDSIVTTLVTDQQEHLLERLTEPGMTSQLSGQLGLGTGLSFLLIMLGAYLGSLAHLFTTAIYLGGVLGRVSEEETADLEEEILTSVTNLVRTSYSNLERLTALAHRFQEKEVFAFIGAGPNYGTACLSAAKLFEQPHLVGVVHHLEEWAHLGLFATRSNGFPVFVLAPPGASRDRALEIIGGIRALGGTVIAICAKEDEEMIASVDDALLIDGQQAETFTPWTYCIPGQIFALTLLDLKGQPPIAEPHSFKQMMQVNFSQIYGSTIRRN